MTSSFRSIQECLLTLNMLLFNLYLWFNVHVIYTNNICNRIFYINIYTSLIKSNINVNI